VIRKKTVPGDEKIVLQGLGFFQKGNNSLMRRGDWGKKVPLEKSKGKGEEVEMRAEIKP